MLETKRLVKFIKTNIFPILLTAVAVVLCVNNYTPGTWLTGWDNLHPEFNFSLNLKRLIFGVWRQEQGLGAVTAHAHMADLPRQLILLIFSLLAPARMLRYLFIFATLILGPLGVYFFAQKALFKNSEKLWAKAAAFLGALYYLLNLGTLQHFVVPFEMFNVQYAALGWLFLFASRYLKSRKRRDLLYFSLVTFLAVPMAYAPMLFYVYLLVLSCYLAVSVLQSRWKKLKPALLLVLATLAINSFWILPNIYFIFNHASDVPKAKINRLFSDEAFLNNKEYGTAKDTAILRNFLFNWAELKADGRLDYLLNSWRIYLKNDYVLGIGYAVFVLVLGGLVISVASKKRKEYLALLPVFLIPFIVLIGINPPFEGLFSFLMAKIPLLEEALRFPFTKFSILLMFSYAVYISLFFEKLLSFCERFLETRPTIVGLDSRISVRKLMGMVVILVVFTFSSSLVVFMKPAFFGKLISPSMRVAIPKRYFEMFEWFDGQEMGRVANFPIHAHWGWTYYDWGYQGSGFIWYGVKQPVLDRDFDRWSPYNEQYYREMSHAVYSKDLELFEALLDKYQINCLLLDKSVILPGIEADPKALFYDGLEEIFARSQKVSLAESFGDELKVYRSSLSYQAENFVYSPERLVKVEPTTLLADIDRAYLDNGPYFSESPGGEDASGLYYPFRTWETFGEGLLEDAIKISGDSLDISASLLGDRGRLLSSFGERYIPTRVYMRKSDDFITLIFEPILPQILDQKIVNFSPYEKKLSVSGNSRNLIISLNRKDNLFIDTSLSEEEALYLGEATLDLLRENSIGLYAAVDDSAEPSDIDKIVLNPELCGNSDRDQFLRVVRQKNNPKEFSLDSRNARACVTLPVISLLPNFEALDANISKELMLQIKFEYEVEENMKPEYCLMDDRTGQCLNNQNPLVSANNYMLDLVKLEANSLIHCQLRFFADNTGDRAETKTTSYKNIKISALEPLVAERFIPDFNFSFASEEVSLVEEKLAARVPLPANLESFSLDVISLKKMARSCGDARTAFYDRQVIDGEKGRYIEYGSEDGSSCDSFSYSNLSHDRGYLLVIEARNVLGLPLRICFSNQVSRKCDLYDQLSDSKEFKNHVFVIPPMEDGEYGYDVNLNNYSVGKFRSINDLKSIRIIPFPYEWVQSIKLGTPKGISEARVTEIERIASFGFGYYLSGVNDKPSFLVLNQSFEKGWYLIDIGKGLPKIISGVSHIVVNGWANGWVLPSGERKIVLVFIPQILEFVGFATSLVWFLSAFAKGFGGCRPLGRTMMEEPRAMPVGAPFFPKTNPLGIDKN